MKGRSTKELLSTGESDALKALRRSGCPEAALVQAWDPASVGRASGPIPLPAQGIQLQLTILEMGKYIDRCMCLATHQKVSRAVETLSLEPAHTLEVFPAAGQTEVIKEPPKETHLFNPANVCSPEK